MADQLYLSLWFPNFRLTSLPQALASVLRQFETVGGSSGVHAAAAYPISWSEPPFYQRTYEPNETEAAAPEAAVAEATESLHDDFGYEFEVTWELWVAQPAEDLDPAWIREPRIVRVTGYGPHFDQSAYKQNGHIRVDFGTDTPFLEEEVELDSRSAERVKQNLQKIIDFTAAVEKNCGISSRLLWSESGENLSQKLIARLQRLN
jgi:hypothetical protein